MHTAAEIREAIKRKRQAGERQRTMQKQLNAASKNVEHVSNREFDLTGSNKRKKGGAR